MHVQIAEIGRPDQHAVAHLAMRRLQISHRLAMIGHGDRGAALGARAEVAGTRNGQVLDLDLISSRRKRLGAIVAAGREVGGQGDLSTKRLRLEMEDHMPWAGFEVENSPPRRALTLLRGEVLISSEVTAERDQMH